jgi:hypothetical protein
VEADGSAYFRLPAGKPVYFQALDERGMAVQSMRSLTYVQPGQRLSCQGCHDHRQQAPIPPREVPLALRRPPSAIQSEADGSNPVLYPRLVQPVLDRSCVPCHRKDPKAPDLGGEIAGKGPWSKSYQVLAPKGFWFQGGNGGVRSGVHGGSRTIPGRFGARASDLYRMLAAGHHDVKLAPEDLRRITLWIDANTNFFGAYLETDKQARGEVVMPTVE